MAVRAAGLLLGPPAGTLLPELQPVHAIAPCKQREFAVASTRGRRPVPKQDVAGAPVPVMVFVRPGPPLKIAAAPVPVPVVTAPPPIPVAAVPVPIQVAAAPAIIPVAAAQPIQPVSKTEPSPPVVSKKGFADKVGHELDYKSITGQLCYIHADGGLWVLRYASVDSDDRFGGSVVLAPTVSMRNYREGDVVTVHGDLVSEARASRSLGAPLYRPASVEMVKRAD